MLSQTVGLFQRSVKRSHIGLVLGTVMLTLQTFVAIKFTDMYETLGFAVHCQKFWYPLSIEYCSYVALNHNV